MSNQEKIDAWRKWLEVRQIEFRENANGHFQIFRGGELRMDLWATKDKYHVKGAPDYPISEKRAKAAIVGIYGPK
ncbi:hypothetical protein D3C71_765670 [compost metagenome]